jgi:hypothetical protein
MAIQKRDVPVEILKHPQRNLEENAQIEEIAQI